jgi:hypothetical protein
MVIDNFHKDTHRKISENAVCIGEDFEVTTIQVKNTNITFEEP